jgi:hypothetical protein
MSKLVKLSDDAIVDMDRIIGGYWAKDGRYCLILDGYSGDLALSSLAAKSLLNMIAPQVDEVANTKGPHDGTS